MKLSLEVEIAAPAAALMPLLLDHARLPLWMSGLVESEQTSPGEPGVGTTFRQVFALGPLRVPLEGALLTFDPPRAFAFEATLQPVLPLSPPMVIRGTWTLTERDGHTTVHYAEESTVDHAAFAFFGPLLAPRVRARHAQAFATLKRLVETGSSL
jgi:uncharacterized protein YndB with AHSA1/START domain